MKIEEKIITLLNTLTEFCLYAMVFVLPFSISLIEIFFGCALISWITGKAVSYKRGDRLINIFIPVKTALNLPIYTFVFIELLSALDSVSLFVSLKGFFIKLLKWVLIYFITIETVNSKKKLKNVLAVMLFSMILISSDGIFQLIRNIDFIRHYYFCQRVQASFGNPNSFAGWLVVMLPLLLSIAYFWNDEWIAYSKKYSLFIKGGVRVMLWMLVGMLIACLIFTYTRGAWIAAILALIFIGVFKHKKFFLIIVMILVALSFVIPNTIKIRAGSITGSVIRVQDQSTVIRLNLWKEALGIIKDYPLFGCGINTYAIVGPNHRITQETGYYPHNCYLHMAAESGLLGLAAFIWIIIALFKASLANVKKIKDEFSGVFLIGLLAGLFGFLVHSFVDTNIYAFQMSILMWFVMGLIIAIQKIGLDKQIP